jgi:hypothetical protein
MTDTRQAQIPLGQAVGQAEAILSRFLTGVLAETGTERPTYLAMQRIALLGGAADRETYVRDLAAALEIDLWAAGELTDKMAASGLFEYEDANVRLSARGAELRGRILGSAGQVTAKLTETLDPVDVETTIRTLQDVTERAREMLAR